MYEEKNIDTLVLVLQIMIGYYEPIGFIKSRKIFLK